MEGGDSGFLKELWKNYQVIQKLQKEWKESRDSSLPIIESFLNLSEQLESCNEGAFEVELRNEFPDLKKRLAYKILKAMEGKMRKLYDLLYAFKNINKKLESVRNSTFQVYHVYSEKVDIEILTRGSPTCPPVSILLEWIIDLNRWYNSLIGPNSGKVNWYTQKCKIYKLPLNCRFTHLVEISKAVSECLCWTSLTQQRYERKKDLLDNICYNDKTYLQSFLRKWKDETCLYRVEGIMEQVAVFLSFFPT